MEAAGKETLPILDHPLGGTIAVTPTGEPADSSMGVVGPNREAASVKRLLGHPLGGTIAVTPTGESANPRWERLVLIGRRFLLKVLSNKNCPLTVFTFEAKIQKNV